MRNLRNLVALGAVLAASSMMALADPIAISSMSAPTGSPDALYPTITGTITPTPIATFTATYTDSVYEGNSFCATCLTFAIQVHNNGSDQLESISTGLLPGDSFSNYSITAGYVSAAGEADPTGASETPSTIHFDFNGIMAGQSSDLLLIETNATVAVTGSVSAQDSSAGSGLGYVPGVAATPEPNSLLLLGTGLIGTAGLLFMRRRASLSL